MNGHQAPKLRLLLGHSAGQRELRAMVIAEGGAGAREVLARVLDGERCVAEQSFRAVAGPRKLVRALERLGVTVWHLSFSALPAGSERETWLLEVTDTSGDLGSVVRPIRPHRASETRVRFAFGSCLYGYHEAHAQAVADALKEVAPEFLLALGDNIYLDVHPGLGERDASLHTAKIYRQTFAESEACAQLLSVAPLLFAFDDHDFYDGFPQIQPHVLRTWLPWVRRRFVRAARHGIELFQEPLNPPAVARGGHSFRFEAGPLSGFMLDIRLSRTSLSAREPRLTSEPELQSLERWAKELSRPGLLALGQPLSIDSGTWHEPNPPRFRHQFERILAAIARAPFDIAVLCGDLHVSQHLSLEVHGQRVEELTSSPLVRIPSFLRNMLHRLIRLREDQEPAAIRLQDPHSAGSPISIADYVMGTSIPNTFALVDARQVATDMVELSVEFVEPGRRGGATCEPDSGLKLEPRVGVGSPCRSTFRLGRR